MTHYTHTAYMENGGRIFREPTLSGTPLNREIDFLDKTILGTNHIGNHFGNQTLT